jgi:hypothetical protein
MTVILVKVARPVGAIRRPRCAACMVRNKLQFATPAKGAMRVQLYGALS